MLQLYVKVFKKIQCLSIFISIWIPMKIPYCILDIKAKCRIFLNVLYSEKNQNEVTY